MGSCVAWAYVAYAAQRGLRIVASALSSTASDPAALERQYVKFCDLHDFDDPRVLSRIGEVVPQVAGDARLHRKYWEYALLTLFLEDLGLLRDDVEVLSVGAGQEEALFWLANRVGRVVAADIYGEGSFADREAE